MFSRFFIDRPIFASVLSLLILLLGGLAIVALPIAQYPEITPPTIRIKATYPGASAETVAQSLAAPIEQQLSGAKDLIYFSSQCTNDGQLTTTATFAIGTDQDLANVDVQNRVKLAEPKLPQEALRQGVVVQKTSTNMLVVLSLQSSDPRFDELYLSNYATANVVDTLKRVPGAGDVVCYGAKDYAMRVWLDPDRLSQLGLTPMDVYAAIKDQNDQSSLGSLGLEPSIGKPSMTLSIQAKGRLVDPQEFGDIVVRAERDGGLVRVRDVAELDLGSYQYTSTSALNGGPTATIGLYQLPTANAFDVIESVRRELDRLSEQFPPGLRYRVTYDTTLFVEASLDDLVKTLIEAGVLVLVTIFIFLQSFRATLIPMIAIPVSIIGTFAMMAIFGFSINTLTLLGLVLAIGLVVDDSIIVVENVYRQLESGVKDPREAAVRAMQEVGGPIVATSSVLLAVFIPAALMPGITGQLYNQFALTIAFSIAFSAINSLTLSPALCAVFLRHGEPSTFRPFVLFNRGFDWLSDRYARLVQWLCRHWYAVVACFLVGCLGVWHYFRVVPTDFVPNEDQGAYFVLYQLPPGSSLLRTQEVSNRIQEIVRRDEAVADAIQINGLNFLTGSLSTNAGVVIVTLKPWDERDPATENVRSIIMRAAPDLRSMPEAIVQPAPPPPIPGLGAVGGWQLQLEALAGQDFDALAEVADAFLAEAATRPELSGLNTPFTNRVPMITLEIDRTRVYALGLDMGTVFDTLGTTMGQAFVNNYNQFGQVYNVMVQGEAGSRMTTMDVMQLRVKNRTGELVPFASFATASIATGTDNATHYNLYNTIQVNGATTAGYGSGDSIKAIDEVAAATLPEGFSYEWTGTTFQEIESAGLAPYVFGLAIVAIFLLLAALYESWLLPFNVLLAVSFAVLFALIALHIAGRSLDVYAQIGLVMLVGLAAKNAILIVEFAKVRADTGEAVIDAASEASRLRLRPIMMTSFAFILGILPLVVATGAGAQARQSIGITVLGGMLGSTIMDQLVVPTFFYMFYSLRRKSGFGTPEGSSGAAPSEASSSTAAHAHG